ncbi:response regulator [Vulgatibacter sp.]|uniref:response regulator n=1 Tax=Vulgatibacter sp. TaxID=1971226 RepID=UPI00356AECCF
MTAAGDTQVLVVDDDFDIRDTLRELLEIEGFRVAIAANGREAIEQLRNGVSPRLILLDLMMPEMSGWEFRSEQLRDPALAEIPVVILSATPDVARTAAALHAAGFVRKPFDLDQLIEMVQERVPK